MNVCAHQLQDLQLAVAIARVYEGDDGLVLRSLLEDKVLPQAALDGNRWLATWTFWMLGRRDMAVRVLIVCVNSYQSKTCTYYAVVSRLYFARHAGDTKSTIEVLLGQ